MSGCYPNVMPEVCPHGILLGHQQCYYCELENKISSLNNRIEGLHAYKLNQINLNDRADKRIDSFETDVAKDIININEQIEKLNKFSEFDAEFITIFKNRIEKLELKNIEHQIKRIADLEREFADFMQKSSLNYQKQPFKCPVCNGCGSETTGLYPCKSCEGIGIVWG